MYNIKILLLMILKCTSLGLASGPLLLVLAVNNEVDLEAKIENAVNDHDTVHHEQTTLVLQSIG